ncbi:MAG: S8 family serine peptidase [Christensenellaceae bacterium]|jgi:subtilisin family serine protease|nr:S8 family serine peptidase [Christensenellaceae bacterium]
MNEKTLHYNAYKGAYFKNSIKFTYLSILLLLVVLIFSFSFFSAHTINTTDSLFSYVSQTDAIIAKYDANSQFTRDIAVEKSYLLAQSGIITIRSDKIIETKVADVNFLSTTEAVLTSGNHSVSLTEGSSYALVDEIKSVRLPKAPQFSYINSQRLVSFPFNDVVLALGYTITDNEESITLSKPFQSRRLIVQVDELLSTYGAVALADGYSNFNLLQYETEDETKYAYDRLLNDLSVELVQPDLIFFTTTEFTEVELFENEGGGESTTQPYSTGAGYSYRTWGATSQYMDFVAYNEKLDLLYGKELPEIIVAVLDSGLDSSHPIFSGRIATGGRNFTGGDTTNYYDDNSHGTHVAGTIVDLTLSNVKILPIKVMNAKGEGTSSQILNGIQYLIAEKKGGRNIVAMNMSLGGQNTGTSLYATSINNAYTAGILSVVAAGNESSNANYTDPAKVPNAITVSAVNSLKKFSSSFSNYGSVIDIAAPGENIVSAIPGNKYTSYSGTSMAAPHVAAAIAAIASVPTSSYTSSTLTQELIKNAQDLGTAGFDNYYGNGFVKMPVLEVPESGPTEEEENGNEPPQTPVTTGISVTAGASVGGTISPSGTFAVEKGSSQSFSFTPSNGYVVTAVVVNDKRQSFTSTTGILKNITSSVTLTVEFTPISSSYIDVTFTGNEGAMLSVYSFGFETKIVTFPSVYQLYRNINYTYRIMNAQPGYSILDITINGSSVGSSYQGWKAFSENASIHIVCALSNQTPQTHTVSASAGHGGAVFPSGESKVLHGGSQTFVVTPDVNFSVSSVKLNDEAVVLTDSNTFTIQNVTSDDVSFEVEFATSLKSIQINITGLGSVDPATTIYVLSEGSQTILFTPSAGYKIGTVLVNNVQVELENQNSYTIRNIIESVVVDAQFVLIQQENSELIDNGKIEEGESTNETDNEDENPPDENGDGENPPDENDPDENSPDENGENENPPDENGDGENPPDENEEDEHPVDENEEENSVPDETDDESDGDQGQETTKEKDDQAIEDNNNSNGTDNGLDSKTVIILVLIFFGIAVGAVVILLLLK